MAEALFGAHLAANILLLGAAWQAGLIPVSLAALEEAVRLNGVEAARNLEALTWGRRWVHDRAAVERWLASPPASRRARPLSYTDRLERYQDRAWARRFTDFVAEVEGRQPSLTDAAARGLFKLMTYKDEYEVARMLSDPEFARSVQETWEAAESIGYNLHPPLLRALGWKRKIRVGPRFRVPLRLLASMKRLRGTWLDPFGRTAMRRLERALIDWYIGLAHAALDAAPHNLELAREILALPDRIRGYEDVKRESIRQAQAAAGEMLARLREERQIKPVC
jgi:indolepyruvate ferredoxin oxidoreductase